MFATSLGCRCVLNHCFLCYLSDAADRAGGAGMDHLFAPSRTWNPEGSPDMDGTEGLKGNVSYRHQWPLEGLREGWT